MGRLGDLLFGRPNGLRKSLFGGASTPEAPRAPEAPVPPPPPASNEGTFVPAVELPDEGAARTVVVDGVPVALVRHEGALYALDNVCPHAGGPMGEGQIEDGALVCPYHSWAFELKTGRCSFDPTLTLPVWPVVEVEGGARICVTLP